MATLLLPPSTSSLSNFCKANPDHLCPCSGRMQVGMLSIPTHYCAKGYKIQCKVMVASNSSGRRFERRFSMTGALEVGSRGADNYHSSGVLDSCNAQSLKELENQLDSLFHEVKALIRSGKESDATELLEANYESVKEQMGAGTKGIEEAAILDVIAMGYMALGDTRVIGPLLDMLSMVVNGLEDNEPLLDSILTHMGNMYEKLQKFETAVDVYNRAVGIIERRYGDSSVVLITPLLGRTKVLASIGKASKAIEGYHRVIKILEWSRGLINDELVLPLVLLGNLLLKEGKATEAEDVFNRTLSIYKKLYGEEDGRVGMAMCSLAHVKCAKGFVNEAIDLYKNALRLIKDSKFMAMEDEVMEKMRIELAELLHVVGRAEEGRALIQESLCICQNYQGKDNPSCVTHLVNLATSYSNSKNFAEAERLLRIGLQILHRSVPADDQSISFPMLHLAVTLYSLNRDEEAEKLALEVLNRREKAFGKESPLVGEALDCLVSVQSRLGRDDSLILGLLERLLKIKEVAFGVGSMEVVETLNKMVHYMDKLGMRIEKLPLQRRLSMLRSRYKEAVKY